ncbi:hypothetical protein [Marinobacterium lutimaris]|uniref:Uncharacterized protein n=1 Tax=Marinobacterium lutimaris TaxID=568106 RepID=A0A1H5VEJ9_9GAMM|nr:hypothetical protein [Marinobacterium lutimaris]SEF85630.1 hypothetical protein SAMN05444390_101710 [Marinobacterium lutimaris]
MAEHTQNVKTGEWLPGAKSTQSTSYNTNSSRELDSLGGFNPLQPWAAMFPWLKFEYLKLEVRLEDDQVRILGEQGRFDRGLHAARQIDASIPAEQIVEAAERMQLLLQQELQQQMNTLMQAAMMPWTMMFPFLKRD